MTITAAEAKEINNAHLNGQIWLLSSLAWTVRIIETRVKNRKRQFKNIWGEWITFDKDDMIVTRDR